MRDFFIRVIINAIAIAITAMVISNIHVVDNDIGTLLIIGLVFGIVNSVLKPILLFLTCPAVILSLGLFVLVINGVMLLITEALIPDRLMIDGGIGTAILGGIVMAIVSMVLESVLKLDNDSKKVVKNGDTIYYDDRG